MSISYPLSFPSTKAPSRIVFRARSVVGVQASPQTLVQTVYAWAGDLWEADIQAPPMTAQYAEAWVSGLLLALNGMEGTFLMGPGNAGYAGPRGTWNGTSPLVHGAHAAGVKTVAIKNIEAGVTWKAGDWLQFGSGSSARLHKVVKDGAAAGSPPGGDIEIWPRTRAALSADAAITLANPMGNWRLSSNVSEWSIELAQIYGISFSCMEAKT
jgi:hypothetical protein